MTHIRKNPGGKLPTIEGNENPQEDYTVVTNNMQTVNTKPSKEEFKPIERIGKKKGNNSFS